MAKEINIELEKLVQIIKGHFEGISLDGLFYVLFPDVNPARTLQY